MTIMTHHGSGRPRRKAQTCSATSDAMRSMVSGAAGLSRDDDTGRAVPVGLCGSAVSQPVLVPSGTQARPAKSDPSRLAHRMHRGPFNRDLSTDGESCPRPLAVERSLPAGDRNVGCYRAIGAAMREQHAPLSSSAERVRGPHPPYPVGALGCSVLVPIGATRPCKARALPGGDLHDEFRRPHSLAGWPAPGAPRFRPATLRQGRLSPNTVWPPLSPLLPELGAPSDGRTIERRRERAAAEREQRAQHEGAR